MIDTATAPTQIENGVKGRNPLVVFFVRLVKEKPLGTVGGILVLIFLLAAIFAGYLAPYGYDEVAPPFRLKPSSAKFILGTDQLGRDVLTRVIYGARISVVVGLAAAAISLLISTAIGTLCGFIGGRFDVAVQRFVDAWMCFPGIIFLMILISLVGTGLWQVIVVLGLQWGVTGSRSVRGPVIGIRENVYVKAATAIGASTFRILWRHIVPNITAVIIILFTTRIPGIIMAEASLSFLGLGIPPPQPSWGGMLSGGARTYMMEAPWMGIYPGIALALLVYGTNMFGDALRDLLDPRLRGGGGRYTMVRRKRGGILTRLRLKKEVAQG
jgi:peptide/nickel transport system permease protein